MPIQVLLYIQMIMRRNLTVESGFGSFDYVSSGGICTSTPTSSPFKAKKSCGRGPNRVKETLFADREDLPSFIWPDEQVCSSGMNEIEKDVDTPSRKRKCGKIYQHNVANERIAHGNLESLETSAVDNSDNDIVFLGQTPCVIDGFKAKKMRYEEGFNPITHKSGCRYAEYLRMKKENVSPLHEPQDTSKIFFDPVFKLSEDDILRINSTLPNAQNQFVRVTNSVPKTPPMVAEKQLSDRKESAQPNVQLPHEKQTEKEEIMVVDCIPLQKKTLECVQRRCDNRMKEVIGRLRYYEKLEGELSSVVFPLIDVSVFMMICLFTSILSYYFSSSLFRAF